MRTVRVKELSLEEFTPYGSYAKLINPNREKIGLAPIEFFRDMVQQDLGSSGAVSFSICRVVKREMIVDTVEYHSKTSEGILPLDNDVLIHVAAATPVDDPVPLDKIVVFHIPKGTMVVLRPGVWHHAPYTVNDQVANVLIVLPERTYANDCQVVSIEDTNRIRIES